MRSPMDKPKETKFLEYFLIVFLSAIADENAYTRHMHNQRWIQKLETYLINERMFRLQEHFFLWTACYLLL